MSMSSGVPVRLLWHAFGLTSAVLLWCCQGALSDSPGDVSPAAAPNGPASDPVTSSGAPGTSSAGTAQLGAPIDCAQVKLAPRRIWRLTAVQYDNTLRDLFGTDSSYGAGFPADEVGVGFGNAADALLMTPLLADKLQSAAEDSAALATLTRFAPCAAASADDACLRELVANFGLRAFRRPLSSEEVERYFALGKQAGEFETGARTVVSAMLQSPHFLYRFELGRPSTSAPDVYDLDDYEIASELSYFLWQSMPDDALFAAAQQGQLHDPDMLSQQVERMLQSERSRPVVRNFVFDWLGLSNILTVPKDTASFPELTAEVRAAMVAEAERFVDHVMFGTGPEQDGSIRALLDAEATFADDLLAGFYDIAAGTGSSRAQGDGQARRGILALGGTLLTHSRSNDSSPIHRGKLVREKLLCQPLPPPPPGLVLQPPGLDPTKTARERYAEHSSNAFCHNCHKLMDPIGLAFEHYDGIGRYRANDHGLPIDPSGEIVPNDNQALPDSDADGAFADSDELIDLLVSSQDVRRCYALEWFRFAYGEGKTERDGEGYPSCQAKRFQDVVAATGGTLPEIVHAFTDADWFFARGAGADVGGAVEEPAAEAGAPSDTDSTGASSEPSSQAQAPEEQASPGLVVERTVENDWGMGYCYTYQLRNSGTESITWSVPLEVRGTMNNHWECKVTADSGMVVFSGEDHNKTIEPGGMAQFGFCAVVNSGS